MALGRSTRQSACASESCGSGPWMTQMSLRHLLGKDNPHADLIFFGSGLDTHDISPQRAIGVIAVPEIFDGDLQFRLQFGAVVQIDQGAMQTEVANDRLLIERSAILPEAGNARPKMRLAAQPIPHRR